MRPSTPIPDSRIQELKDFRKKKWPGNEFLRFLCVWLRVDKGMVTTKIAEVLNWNVNTVRRIQKGFIDHGTEVLIESKKGGRQRQLMTFEAEKTFLSKFLEKANKGLILVIREIKDALEIHVGHKVHKTTVYRMLYRHGWRKVVPRKSHPKRDKEAGEDFKKKGFSERVAKANNKERPLRIMFQDEARFGRISDPKACWAMAPVRPEVGAQMIREYVYVFGAVCPQDGRHDSLVLPVANTEAMSMFLKEVSGRYPNEHILMFMDQARWHTAHALKLPNNIEIAFLPPYSPDLNPQEQVWDEMREKFFGNRFFKSIQAVIDAACESLNRLESTPEILKSLTHRNWILNSV